VTQSNINNVEDKFGKTVGSLTAAWMTVNKEASKAYSDRIEYHTERMVMHMGFPQTGFDMAEMVLAISQIGIAELILDEYIIVGDKGFVKFEEETQNPPVNPGLFE
jgi:hypothetical protein